MYRYREYHPHLPHPWGGVRHICTDIERALLTYLAPRGGVRHICTGIESTILINLTPGAERAIFVQVYRGPP
jgi:hypothetical protein